MKTKLVLVIPNELALVGADRIQEQPYTDAEAVDEHILFADVTDGLLAQLRDANLTIRDLKKDSQLDAERTKMAAVEAMREAVAHARAEMQKDIDVLKEKLDVMKEAAAAAKAEANTLRGFRDANDELRITVGEQRARITMLEDQIEALKLA